MHREGLPFRCLMLAALGWALVRGPAAWAQDPKAEDPKQAEAKSKVEAVLRSIDWVKGAADAKVGDQGELKVPEGYLFTGGPGTRKMLELMENPTNGQELGLLAPMSMDWFIIFEFSSDGYIKDADKEELDPDDILDSIKKGTEQSNEERSRRGWPSIHIVGWQTAPFFDKATKNLQWAIKGESQGHSIVNYNTRILGRHGVMSANLLISPEKLAATLPVSKGLLAGFGFQAGKRYSEYKPGDKIAEYGLAALIAGGGLAAAAKLGLLGKLAAMLGKLWKFLILGLLALGAGIKSLFFGKKSKPAAPQEPPPAGPDPGAGG